MKKIILFLAFVLSAGFACAQVAASVSAHDPQPASPSQAGPAAATAEPVVSSSGGNVVIATVTSSAFEESKIVAPAETVPTLPLKPTAATQLETQALPKE